MSFTIFDPYRLDDQLKEVYAELTTVPSWPLNRPRPHYLRPWRSALSHNDSGSTVSRIDNAYTIVLDVQQFAPNEITVKVVGEEYVVVEGQHEEKEEANGTIMRHFVRKYLIPKGYDADKTESCLSSDGILQIAMVKMDHGSKERVIPIKMVGALKKREADQAEDKENASGTHEDEPAAKKVNL